MRRRDESDEQYIARLTHVRVTDHNLVDMVRVQPLAFGPPLERRVHACSPGARVVPTAAACSLLCAVVLLRGHAVSGCRRARGQSQTHANRTGNGGPTISGGALGGW